VAFVAEPSAPGVPLCPKVVLPLRRSQATIRPDLLCVLEILEQPIEILHYFFRRADFEKYAKYKGAEADLLAFYLDTGFNIGTLEEGDSTLILVGSSYPVDAWFMAPWAGRNVKKPRPRRTQWFRDILQCLQARKPTGWTLMASVLLNVSVEDQKEFEAVCSEH
jgi:hypothetical protein